MAFQTRRCTIVNILPVVFVVWVIGTIWTVHMFLHLVPLAHTDPDRAVIEIGVSQWLTFMMLLCMMLAMITDPGSVPDSSEWARSEVPEGALTSTTATVEVKQKGGRRYCKWCDRYKPDRCHHCRTCGSCILRMDHHCPWIVNCVGFRNHKYFFLLVSYALLNCSWIMVTLRVSVMKAYLEYTTPTHRFLLVFAMTMTTIMATLLGLFFSLHVWLTATATTTIEFCEKRYRFDAGKCPDYDLGLYKNICSVLGPSPVFWPFPWSLPDGDGTNFPTKHTAASWPKGAVLI